MCFFRSAERDRTTSDEELISVYYFSPISIVLCLRADALRFIRPKRHTCCVIHNRSRGQIDRADQRPAPGGVLAGSGGRTWNIITIFVRTRAKGQRSTRDEVLKKIFLLKTGYKHKTKSKSTYCLQLKLNVQPYTKRNMTIKKCFEKKFKTMIYRLGRISCDILPFIVRLQSWNTAILVRTTRYRRYSGNYHIGGRHVYSVFNQENSSRTCLLDCTR